MHNDYLEQASDSGVPGFLLYVLLVAGCLVYGRPRASSGGDWQAFWVWLGVVGWALQAFVEFPLYLPALSWPAFALLGWLLGRPKPFAEAA